VKQKRNQWGAVTAETAVALPVLILMTAALAWVVSLGVTQVRAVDAARETARALARGEDEGVSKQLGQRIAPDGARIRITDDDGEITVEISAPVTGPGGIFGFLPNFTARSTAVAQAEP
jgi:hypothetical protein